MVTPHDVGQSPVPAVALTAENSERRRGLGPGHRVGDEVHPPGPALLPAPTPESEHQLHIFTDSVMGIAAVANDDIRVIEEAVESSYRFTLNLVAVDGMDRN